VVPLGYRKIGPKKGRLVEQERIKDSPANKFGLPEYHPAPNPSPLQKGSIKFCSLSALYFIIPVTNSCYYLFQTLEQSSEIDSDFFSALTAPIGKFTDFALAQKNLGYSAAPVSFDSRRTGLRGEMVMETLLG